VPKQSAGVLLYRQVNGEIEVMLVHPGGPFWARKDLGAWSIPKGEFADSEDPLQAALRELEEETGSVVAGTIRPLSPVKQKGGKVVYGFAVEGDWDVSRLRSNTFRMEYPPKSGRMTEFPEIDRAAWFSLAIARQKILSAQEPFLDELIGLVAK
jgi:predicted NUDIX family NTP pyrophosphohydrolase